MSLKDRLHGLLTKVRPKRLSASVVQAGRLDDLALEDARERAPRFDALFGHAPEVAERHEDGVTTPAGPYAGWEDLVGDVFRAHHTEDEPRIRDEDQVKPSARLHREIMERLVTSEQMTQARAYTRSDDLGSALATMAAAGSLKASLEGALAKEAERAERMREAEQELDEAEERLRELGEASEAGPLEADEAAEQQTLEAVAEALRGALGREAEAGERGLVEVGQAARQAGQEAAEAARASRATPGLGPGERRRMPLEAQIAWAERWLSSPRLKEIAELAGRMQRDMAAARARRIKGAREVPVEVVAGDDLTALLPHEQMGLRVPAMRRDVLQRLGQRQVLCWRFEGTDRAKRGPIVAVVDSSDSMKGQRIVWAKAVCLSLITLAHRDRRDAAVVEFGSRERLADWQFPHRRTKGEDLAEMAASFFASGTHINGGLRRAMEIMDRAPAFAQADVVLITDGEDAWDEESGLIRRRLVELGVRVQGVNVGRGPSTYTNRMCDQQVSVSELTEPSDATRAVATHLTPP